MAEWYRKTHYAHTSVFIVLMIITRNVLGSSFSPPSTAHLYYTEITNEARLYPCLGGGVKILLLVVSLFGFFTFDMVYMFSILNYVAQGEMNIYLLWDIRRLIKLRQHDNIDCAIKDVQKCKQYLDVLNGKTASLTSLALFVLGNLTMLTIIDLNNIDKTERAYASGDFQILAGVSSFLNALCWSLLFTLPFVQASIFGVPIYPWLMYLLAVAFSFTMLVLFQLDVYSIARYI